MNFMICAALLSAQTEVGEWYATGGVFLENVEYDVPAIDFGGFITPSFTLEFDQETSFRVGAGTRLNEQFNLELQLGSGSGNGASDLGGILAAAEYDYTTFGAMLTYPIAVTDQFTFTPKAGVGFTQAEGAFIFIDQFGDFIAAAIDDSAFSFTLEASADYAISESANIFAGYRIETTDFSENGDLANTGLIFGAQFSF